MPDALKDTFFTLAFLNDLSAAITAVYPAFDGAVFLDRVLNEDWPGRELKARMRHITVTLRDFLPADYRAALDVLQRAAPAVSQYGFDKMVFSDFVEVFGLEDWDASLPVLEAFTQEMTAEFAVRPFIEQDPPRMMAQMLAWARHPSEAVRRLASEGCRPRLPWAMRLPTLVADPAPILPLLDVLKDDESESVRRSVANNLNDIAKDHPEVVIEVLRGWQDHASPEIAWITRHALRTLLKQGHPGALALLGFEPDAAVTVRGLRVEPESVALGEEITVTCEIVSEGDAPQDLMIDYVMHFMKANGQLAPKVFKLTTRTLAPGEATTLRKLHSFRAITTRRYYPGPHAVEIQVNGTVLARQEFTVTE